MNHRTQSSFSSVAQSCLTLGHPLTILLTLVISEHLTCVCWVADFPDNLVTVLHCYWGASNTLYGDGGGQRAPNALSGKWGHWAPRPTVPWDVCLVKAAPLHPFALFPIQDHNQYPLAVNSLPMAEMKRKKKTLFLIHLSRTAAEGIWIKKSGKHSQQTLLSFSLLGRELRRCHRSNISMKSSLIISTRVCPASKPHYLKRKKSGHCYE